MLTGNQPAEIFSSSSAFATHFKFTAGVGENNPLIRRKVCEYFGYLGIEIDDVKNEKRGEDLVISTPQSNVKVMVIATDEELKIARETLANI